MFVNSTVTTFTQRSSLVGLNVTTSATTLNAVTNFTTACGKNKFGANCAETCGHCKIKDCSPDTGECYGGCEPGYTGAQCKDRKYRTFFVLIF